MNLNRKQPQAPVQDGSQTAKRGARALFASRQSRYGLFSAVLIAVVAVIVILFNLALKLLPTNYTQFDLSSQQLYTVSDTSAEYLAGLDKDVDIILVAENGAVDQRITSFADNYAALSDHVNVTMIDPVQTPSVLTDYNTELNTVVISCPETGKQETIAFSDIVVMDEYYAYYGYEVESEFDADGQFTSAIDYVVSENSHTIYCETGHGETSLGTGISDRISKNNFTLSEVNLLMDGAIPEDCDLLLLNRPTSDLSQDEVTMLENYLAGGGQVTVILDSDTAGFANLNGLLNTWGLNIAQGDLADESRYYSQLNSAFVFFPVLNTASSSVTAGYSSEDMVLVGFDGTETVSPAVPLEEVTPARDTITVDAFLKTSEYGLAYVDQETYTQNSFVVGAVASEVVDETSGAAARLMVISADTLLDDMITTYFPQLKNLDVFMSALTAGFDDISNISIAAKSLTATYNTVNNVNLLGILCVAVIPGIFLVGGFLIWLRRRKL